MITCPSIGPNGGPAAAIPAGTLVLNLDEWSILSATFFMDFNLATDLDIFRFDGRCFYIFVTSNRSNKVIFMTAVSCLLHFSKCEHF